MKVLVTHATAHSGLAMIRSLAAGGHDPIGADLRRLPFGLHSRHTPPYELLPELPGESLANHFLELVEHHRPDVAIPFRESRTIAKYLERFAGKTRLLLPLHSACVTADHKAKLLAHCAASGIEVPASHSFEEASRHLEAETGKAPARRFVVSPCQGAGGGRGTSIVSSQPALVAAEARARAISRDVLITDWVPGPVTQLRNVHLLFDRTSRLIGFFVLRKRLQYPERVGASVVAESTHEVELVEHLLPLFESLQWRGPADVDLKIDSRDGRPRVLEVNPRFGATTGFAIASGVPFGDLHCRAAMGEDLPEISCPMYPEGLKYVHAPHFARVVARSFRSGGLRAARRIAGEARGARAGSPYRLSDPGPEIGKLLLGMKLGVARLRRRLASTS